MKKEYPKMIYKGGVMLLSNPNRVVVYDERQHHAQLKAWGDLDQEKLEKKPEPVKDQVQEKTEVADSVEPEVKPTPKKKKTSRKKVKKS